jgi:hypothetical protein
MLKILLTIIGLLILVVPALADGYARNIPFNPPGNLLIRINDRDISAVRGQGARSTCSRLSLEKLGIPIYVQPTKYVDHWQVIVGQSDPTQTPQLIHLVDKEWIVPVDISVGDITKHNVPVVVRENMSTSEMPGDPARFELGKSFFDPQNVSATTIASTHASSEISKTEVRRIDEQAAREKAECEAQLQEAAKWQWLRELLTRMPFLLPAIGLAVIAILLSKFIPGNPR